MLQFQQAHGMKCGICGDSFNGRLSNQAGGQYATGVIAATYLQGQEINITVQITANHKGFFEFRLCVNNDYKKVATQECLDQNILQGVKTGTRKFYIGTTSGYITKAVILPPNVTCDQCVLQWRYKTGERNNASINQQGWMNE